MGLAVLPPCHGTACKLYWLIHKKWRTLLCFSWAALRVLGGTYKSTRIWQIVFWTGICDTRSLGRVVMGNMIPCDSYTKSNKSIQVQLITSLISRLDQHINIFNLINNFISKQINYMAMHAFGSLKSIFKLPMNEAKDL